MTSCGATRCSQRWPASCGRSGQTVSRWPESPRPNRLELGRAETARYHKISHDAAAIERLFVDVSLDAEKRPPKQVTLDLDATDDPLHGHHGSPSRLRDGSPRRAGSSTATTTATACAPTARITNGGRIRPDRCRFGLVADQACDREGWAVLEDGLPATLASCPCPRYNDRHDKGSHARVY